MYLLNFYIKNKNSFYIHKLILKKSLKKDKLVNITYNK